MNNNLIARTCNFEFCRFLKCVSARLLRCLIVTISKDRSYAPAMKKIEGKKNSK